MISRQKWWARAGRHLFAVAALGAASCGPLVELPGGGEAPRLLDLIPTASASSNTSPKATVLMEALAMPSSLRSDVIAIRPTAREVKYLSNVRWSERAANLIYRYLRTTFESSDSLQVIANNSLDVASGYRLRIEIRDFSLHEGETEDRGEVQIRGNVLLIRNGPTEILASRRFSADREVSFSQGAEEVAAAFNAALDQFAFDLLQWTEQEIAGAGS